MGFRIHRGGGGGESKGACDVNHESVMHMCTWMGRSRDICTWIMVIRMQRMSEVLNLRGMGCIHLTAREARYLWGRFFCTFQATLVVPLHGVLQLLEALLAPFYLVLEDG